MEMFAVELSAPVALVNVGEDIRIDKDRIHLKSSSPHFLLSPACNGLFKVVALVFLGPSAQLGIERTGLGYALG
jgi:hypothetical protein